MPMVRNTSHASDCATNNGPAYPPGQCTCGAAVATCEHENTCLQQASWFIIERDGSTTTLCTKHWHQRTHFIPARIMWIDG